MKILILGVGNPILQDDGIGLHVAKSVKERLADTDDVTVDYAFTGGLNLIDLMIGFEKVIIIDAIHDEKALPGEIKKLALSDLQKGRTANPHDVSLPEAFRLAKTLGETRLPHQVVIYGIVSPTAPATFGEHVSKALAPAVPKAVKMVLDEVSCLRETKPGFRGA